MSCGIRFQREDTIDIALMATEDGQEVQKLSCAQCTYYLMFRLHVLMRPGGFQCQNQWTKDTRTEILIAILFYVERSL